MSFSTSTRTFARCAAVTGAAVLLCANVPAQVRHQRLPAPIVRRPPPPAAAAAAVTPAPIQRRDSPAPKGPNGEHLAGWLNQHGNETPAQQLQSLEREPGFHDLPPQTQQRYRDQLLRLDNMSPQQRNKLISHTEVMERLTPDQRGQVRSAMQQWASLPPASHRAVGRTFRIVRGMPPAQRLAYLNSPDIRSQFTEPERNALAGLMAVESYLPPSNPNQGPPQP